MSLGAAPATCRPLIRADGALGRRVGIVADEYPVISETFVAELVDGLAAQGCDLRILAANPLAVDLALHDGSVPAPLAGRIARSAAHRPFGVGEAIGFWHERRRNAAVLVLLGVLDALALRASHRLRVARMMAREAPFDIVHCQFAPLGLLALRHMRLGTLVTRKLVVHLRGSDISAFVVAHGPGVYDDLWQKADLIIANCRYFRDRAIAMGCPTDKLIVIGSPIDTQKFSPLRRASRRPGAPLSLIAVGRLVEKKGFAYAIQALGLLAERGVDARLRLVGDGPLRGALSEQVSRLGIADRVRFDGAQAQAGVIAALAESDIALAPSVRAADGNEDAPVNTLKEAMAMGLPVVATRHGGIPELVRDRENGRLVEERHAEGLAAAIAELDAARDTWAALGRAGRAAVVAEFDKEVVVARTLAAYRSVLEKD